MNEALIITLRQFLKEPDRKAMCPVCHNSATELDIVAGIFSGAVQLSPPMSPTLLKLLGHLFDASPRGLTTKEMYQLMGWKQPKNHQSEPHTLFRRYFGEGLLMRNAGVWQVHRARVVRMLIERVKW